VAGGARRGSSRSAPVHRARWTTLERDLRRTGATLIAGVDEVGRGCLAGPVVACAIVMPHDKRAIRGVDDSKMLTAIARRRLARVILERALGVGIGAASAAEIDRYNIYQASALAMRRALSRLALTPDQVLVDGRPIRSLRIPHTAVVDGDDKCFSIACASIVAKVTRDRLMARLSQRHPGYAWERNCGYATRSHVAGLNSLGPTPHHRRSFFRVLAALEAAGAIAADSALEADSTSVSLAFDAAPELAEPLALLDDAAAVGSLEPDLELPR